MPTSYRPAWVSVDTASGHCNLMSISNLAAVQGFALAARRPSLLRYEPSHATQVVAAQLRIEVNLLLRARTEFGSGAGSVMGEP